MRGIMLQDWVTLRGQGGTTTPIIQGQPFWLDLLPYRDVIAWLEVRNFTTDAGTVQLSYQTSPTQDEGLFATMAGPLTVSVGVMITQMIAPIIATVPLSRYFRWLVSPSTAPTNPWDITFRILIAVNQPGSARSAVSALVPPPSNGLVAPSPGNNDPSLPDQQGGAISRMGPNALNSGRPKVTFGLADRFSKT